MPIVLTAGAFSKPCCFSLFPEGTPGRELKSIFKRTFSCLSLRRSFVTGEAKQEHRGRQLVRRVSLKCSQWAASVLGNIYLSCYHWMLRVGCWESFDFLLRNENISEIDAAHLRLLQGSNKQQVHEDDKCTKDLLRHTSETASAHLTVRHIQTNTDTAPLASDRHF